MKLLLPILLFICSTVVGQRKRGPDTARISHPDGSYVELISPDTNHVKVYPADTLWVRRSGLVLEVDTDSIFSFRYKLDTIGGWHLVSDTTKATYNPVYCMYLWEVRKYENDWIMVTDGNTEWSIGQRSMFATPHHHLWLDANKKPIKLKVWQ